jgi:hypothetical protein
VKHTKRGCKDAFFACMCQVCNHKQKWQHEQCLFLVFLCNIDSKNEVERVLFFAPFVRKNLEANMCF